jgi:hypothetical protein
LLFPEGRPLSQLAVRRGKNMTVKELQKMAKQLGVNPVKLRKAELIKAIQRAEGHFDCFGTAKDYCDQVNCLFREDCLE